MKKDNSFRVIVNYCILTSFFNISMTQIHVSLSDDIRTVPLFGLANSSMRYNNYNESNIEYDFGEVNFERAVECINPHVLAFPAANPCYFDWTTGWSYPESHIIDYVNTLNLSYDINLFSPGIESNGHYFFEISNRDYDWWKNADGSWNSININVDDFSNFIGNEIAGIFSLNMLTSDIETTMDMITENYINTVPFKYVELGSEYYLRGGGDKWTDEEPRNYKYDEGETLIKDVDEDGYFDPGRFDFIYPTPQSFAEECNIWIQSLSSVLDDNTKYAISSKNKPNDPRSDDWNRQVLKHINSSLIDTIYLSWHEYLVIGESVDNPIPLTEEQVLAFPQFTHNDVLTNSGMHPDTIAELEEELDINIKIWLTESAFRERNYDERPWIFKWAQTLVNIQNYSLKLRNPYIDIIMIQSLMGWSSTSSINHGNDFPDYVPDYNGEDSCSPYGRTATAFSINFWNDISDEMTYMQELEFISDNNEHLGTISEDPFDNYLSPDIGYTYSYLLGWKLFNEDKSIQRALITNISDEEKKLIFNNSSGFTNNNLRCTKITSRNENNIPSINQYINGDSDLYFDTTYIYIPYYLDRELNVPAYSLILLEEIPSSSSPTSYYNLHSVYPNPFNSVTNIQYELSKTNFVSINVYDIQGRLVKKLYNAEQISGHHMLQWDASNVSSGVYVIRMQIDDKIKTNIISLLK